MSEKVIFSDKYKAGLKKQYLSDRGFKSYVDARVDFVIEKSNLPYSMQMKIQDMVRIILMDKFYDLIKHGWIKGEDDS